MRDQPLLDLPWIFSHTDDIWAQLIEHLQLTLIAVVAGALIAAPLSLLAYRRRRTYPVITGFTGLLYTIPSLALFAFLVPYTGLTTLTAEIGLVGYTLLILIRNTITGLDQVPADVKEAASGLGYTPRDVLWKIEVPLALPSIFAGIRLATVSTIGLVTVTALIGKGGLGQLILTGIDRFFPTPALVGAFLSVLLAVVADRLLAAVQRAVMPWDAKAAR